ncbi:MAG: DUF432 domain-containing protein [Nitrosopumilus sp.]|nr:DUF432 domain-containing protein [Nitrosopumilus sp.]MDH3516303.1 DUF432 domain-containing protein [Nitrosopumilus sp.]MDH3564068.1 DUF432 domain-containing protein [Nitrosopumilus sp.]MDH5417442.1 DUF432 domain-containing protein [Nitrosopumilus sp.]
MSSKINMEKNDYSGFGQYDISEKLELRLPKTEINIEIKEGNRFSYYRKNSEDQEIRKSIPQSSGKIKIELCPILPMNLPAKKTNDLIFLRLAESIFVEKKSTTSILIQFPMEIGIYIINQDETKDLFDCFTCEPMHSRFALYGTPEKGNLCMYSKVKLLEKNDVDPYVFARMKVDISNNLDEGKLIGKLVFPIGSHNFYYSEGSSEVHVDDIEVTLKQESKISLIDIKRKGYVNKGAGLKLVSYLTTDDSIYTMDKGFN